jgi:hypothetical protein
MTALELYKYIKNYQIEWHWIEDEEGQDVIIFPYIFQLEDFTKLLSSSDFDDDGIVCNLKHDYIVIKLKDLCESNGIELSEVFPENENDF